MGMFQYGYCMKITLNIANPLLAEAKAVARKKKITVRALVERGLKLALAEHEDRRAIKLRDASVTGKGLRPDAAELSWDQLRALTHRPVTLPECRAGGGTLPGVDLNDCSSLLDQLDGRDRL